MTIEELLHKADTVIAEELRTELRRQGHYNTGKLDQSIEGKVTNGNHLEGFASYYAAILQTGYGRERASMRQFPFVKNYFLSKGYDDATASRIAAMTINAWRRDGVPTNASAVYSETGIRTLFVTIVRRAISGKLNALVTNGVDKIVNQKFHETKSETI